MPIAAALVLAGLSLFRHRPPPVVSDLPSFSLIDQTGARFGSEQLKGKVWIANFIYTRCGGVCPRFTAQMAELERRAEKRKLDVRFVSFALDPAHDGPDALREFARAHGADWTFLTGTVDEVQAAVVKGLKIAANPEAEDPASMFHGSYFVLVDGDGRVRGYYDSGVPERVDAILPDAAAVVAAAASN